MYSCSFKDLLFSLQANRPERGKTAQTRTELDNKYKSGKLREGAWQSESDRCGTFVTEVNAEWLAKQRLKHTAPTPQSEPALHQSERQKWEMQQRFKRQSSVIGNDRQTQSIHHLWPLLFPFFYCLFLFSIFLYSGARAWEEKKKLRQNRSVPLLGRWFLIRLWKLHRDAVNLEPVWRWHQIKGVNITCMWYPHRNRYLFTDGSAID